jgi:hypothetical protein
MYWNTYLLCGLLGTNIGNTPPMIPKIAEKRIRGKIDAPMMNQWSYVPVKKSPIFLGTQCLMSNKAAGARGESYFDFHVENVKQPSTTVYVVNGLSTSFS